jgi:cytochrome c biogenesis protein CcmG, thiol:disulfide interchange protein DsbE
MNRKVLVIGSVLAAALVIILFAGLGKDPQAIDSPLIGRPAPPFALRAVGSGETINLEQFKGRPVVLNFWATWCVPCFEEHPILVANARALQPNVQFLGVVFQDNEERIQKFLDDRGRAYPTVVDDAGKTAIAYGVGGVPETFFLDASGTIVAKYAGPLTDAQLQTNLEKAMKR